MRIEKSNFLIQVKYSDLTTETKNIEKFFFGFSGELYLTAEEITKPDPKIIETIKSFIKNKDLSLRLHAPICEIDYSQAKKTISSLQPLHKKVIEFCKALNINSVVAHAEFNYKNDFVVDNQFYGALLVWRVLAGEFRANKICINLENHLENKPDHLIQLMECINSNFFGMCVDAGHFNAFSKLDIRECLGRYPLGSIKEIHLADNKGDRDTHLALGDGNIDFFKFFMILEKRKEKHIFVLEPNNLDEAGKSLSFLKKSGLIE